jgi:Uma2 family endonuclease
LPFRPLPEHELWAADVAYVSKERWEQIDPEDNLVGAPDLVIEVLSPSNTAAEINDRENGITTAFRAGQEILLRVCGSRSLKVDAIFA